jgi:hypothetical protein
MRGFLPQQLDDIGQPIRLRRGAGAMRMHLADTPSIPHHGRGHLCGRQNEIDGAGCNGGTRHAVEPGLARILHDDQAAFFLHRLHPQAAIGAGAGENDANGMHAIRLGQRTQQKIHRQSRTVARSRL